MQTVAVAVRIRGVLDADMTSLLPIWRAAVEASHGFLTSEDVDWYEKLSFLPRMRDLRVAVDENEVALRVIAQDAGEIQMLFVSPEAQGRGVGSALLDMSRRVNRSCGLMSTSRTRPRLRSTPPRASPKSDDRR